jgi:pimeloyl-ACP methyl ester carboxylesterase
MASSAGPGLAQLEESNGYATSLKSRLPNNGMLEKFRIYREGLFRGPWEKSIETVVALSEIQTHAKRGSGGSRAGLFDDGPPGALKAPATIVYGADDPAFESQLVLGGIGDYLSKDSQVVVLEDSGHWLPLEELGSSVLEEVVTWAMSGEQEALKESFTGKWKEKVRFHVQV